MKILYLYNKENWALHNVGKLWFGNISNKFEVDFSDYHGLGITDFLKYDYVWFSLYIYEKYRYNPKKSIITIHDPIELFPQKKTWQTSKIKKARIDLLRRFEYINVISKEIRGILVDYGIYTTQIPTTSLLPFRVESEISLMSGGPKLLSVAKEYPRKNISLMREIQSSVSSTSAIFNIKLGNTILPQHEYIDFLDSHEIYVCTSFQEGGPLPAMDAMARGLTVLTTPVGQIQELITDGFNGYICDSRDEFIKKISLLVNNKNLLKKMRINSLITIKERRGQNEISEAVNDFLNTLN